MHLYDHKAVVWDLDGTLYYQRDMRIKMALSLVSYYLIRPHRIKELLAVKQFRQIRESWKDEENTGDALKKAADGMMKGCVGLDELSALQYARTAMDLNDFHKIHGCPCFCFIIFLFQFILCRTIS